MMDDQVPNVCLQRCRLKRPTDEVDELFRKQDEGEEGASRMVNGEVNGDDVLVDSFRCLLTGQQRSDQESDEVSDEAQGG